MMVLTASLIPLTIGRGHRVNRLEGGLLVLAYLGYMTYCIVRELVAPAGP